MTTAICPGTFDPVTNGHINIIERAAKLFDKVVVCIMVNPYKSTHLFSDEERLDLMRRSVAHLPNVSVDAAEELLAEYAGRFENPVIIKGLRVAGDFEYESQLDQVNKHINPAVETLFIPSDGKLSFLSSTVVRELAKYGSSIEGLVPDCIIPDIENKAKQWRQK